MAETEIETTIGETDYEEVEQAHTEDDLFECDSDYEIQKLEELRKAQNTEVFTIIGLVYLQNLIICFLYFCK